MLECGVSRRRETAAKAVIKQGSSGHNANHIKIGGIGALRARSHIGSRLASTGKASPSCGVKWRPGEIEPINAVR